MIFEARSPFIGRGLNFFEDRGQPGGPRLEISRQLGLQGLHRSLRGIGLLAVGREAGYQNRPAQSPPDNWNIASKPSASPPFGYRV